MGGLIETLIKAVFVPLWLMIGVLICQVSELPVVKVAVCFAVALSPTQTDPVACFEYVAADTERIDKADKPLIMVLILFFIF